MLLNKSDPFPQDADILYAWPLVSSDLLSVVEIIPLAVQKMLFRATAEHGKWPENRREMIFEL